MINWELIQKTCPKAWKVFQESSVGIGYHRINKGGDLEAPGGENGEYDTIFNERNLYDFFDDNEIYLTVTPYWRRLPHKNTFTNVLTFAGEVAVISTRFCMCTGEYRTLVEAEMFEIAFGQLEQRLKLKENGN